MPAVTSATTGAVALAACACTRDSATSSIRSGSNSILPRCTAATSMTADHVDAASLAKTVARGTPHASRSHAVQFSSTSLRTSLGSRPGSCSTRLTECHAVRYRWR